MVRLPLPTASFCVEVLAVEQISTPKPELALPVMVRLPVPLAAMVLLVLKTRVPLPLPRLVLSTVMEPAPLVRTLLPPVSMKASPVALALATLARMEMLPPPALSVEPDIFTALLVEPHRAGATAPRIVMLPPPVLSTVPPVRSPRRTRRFRLVLA
jgi:hypothetical protein